MARCTFINFDRETMGSRERLTFEERKLILKLYFKYESISEVRRQWSLQFQSDPRSRLTISRLRDKFEENGTVQDVCASQSGRPRTSRSDANVALVLGAFGESTRRASHETGISQSTVCRILKDNGMKPYRPVLLHHLNDDDPDRRVEFAEWFINSTAMDETFPDAIIWSDEATFKMNGRVNRHNCVFWSHENPREVMQREVNVPGVSVWAGISSRGLIGPLFFDGNVNGERYLQLLKTEVEPVIRRLFPEEPVHFQQDGAPPHYALAVRHYLDATFPGKWIGRRGPVEYPPRSPDLTPLDFFFSGQLKNIVFKERVRSIQELKDRIVQCSQEIPMHLYKTVCQSVLSRCRDLIAANGHHFEHMT